jgi:hypothetical protein
MTNSVITSLQQNSKNAIITKVKLIGAEKYNVNTYLKVYSDAVYLPYGKSNGWDDNVFGWLYS